MRGCGAEDLWLKTAAMATGAGDHLAPVRRII